MNKRTIIDGQLTSFVLICNDPGPDFNIRIWTGDELFYEARVNPYLDFSWVSDPRGVRAIATPEAPITLESEQPVTWYTRVTLR